MHPIKSLSATAGRREVPQFVLMEQFRKFVTLALR